MEGSWLALNASQAGLHCGEGKELPPPPQKITRDHSDKTVLQLGWRSSRVLQGSLWKQDEKATFRFRADEK